MASVVDICNGALNQLGASTILSLTEDSKNHYGFDTKEEKTTEEIFALEKDRQIRRKYIIKR